MLITIIHAWLYCVRYRLPLFCKAHPYSIRQPGLSFGLNSVSTLQLLNKMLFILYLPFCIVEVTTMFHFHIIITGLFVLVS